MLCYIYEEPDMSNEQLIPCMEQKVILLTKILDLTKQIEVRCKQNEILIDELLQMRKGYLSRVEKCNFLIDKILAEAQSDETDRLSELLAAKVGEHGCSDDELTLLRCAKRSKELSHAIIRINKNAQNRLNAGYETLKSYIIDETSKKRTAVSAGKRDIIRF